VTASDAKALVKAKTPIATVLSKLARRAADATDALAVDRETVGAAETSVAAAGADACRADLDHRLCDNFGNGVLRSTKWVDRSVYRYARSRRSASSGSPSLSSLINRLIVMISPIMRTISD
jgi:hypothetical protein